MQGIRIEATLGGGPMKDRLFHIYRNNPLGRETLMQSVFFCKRMGLGLTVYVPKWRKFDLQFGAKRIRLRLDPSYLSDPETAVGHAREVAEAEGMKVRFFQSKNGGAPKAPNLTQGTAFMTCPRAISAPFQRIGLGFIGGKVRAILESSTVPILMPSPVFKPWSSVTVLFGHDAESWKALRLGASIAKRTQMPLEVVTQQEQAGNGHGTRLRRAELEGVAKGTIAVWHRFSKGSFRVNLGIVPHDALVLMGASEKAAAHRVLSKSKMDIVQETLNNNFLIVGPQACRSDRKEKEGAPEPDPIHCRV
jgi:hypothetical protein